MDGHRTPAKPAEKSGGRKVAGSKGNPWGCMAGGCFLRMLVWRKDGERMVAAPTEEHFLWAPVLSSQKH